MFKEKLNIANSKITYILVDKSKMIKELDTNFPIPVECHPLALNSVKEKLIELGAIEIKLRQALKKDGPVITENNNLILDVRFTEIYETLEKDIKAVVFDRNGYLYHGKVQALAEAAREAGLEF